MPPITKEQILDKAAKKILYTRDYHDKRYIIKGNMAILDPFIGYKADEALQRLHTEWPDLLINPNRDDAYFMRIRLLEEYYFQKLREEKGISVADYIDDSKSINDLKEEKVVLKARKLTKEEFKQEEHKAIMKEWEELINE